MLADKRSHIRELAIRKILKSRPNSQKKNIRIFRVPKLNFAAQDYIDLIDWFGDVTEPPLTMHIPDEDLLCMIQDQETINFKRFPCHTQAVERTVKIVTDASSTVCGPKARDGYIRAKLKARAKGGRVGRTRGATTSPW